MKNLQRLSILPVLLLTLACTSIQRGTVIGNPTSVPVPAPATPPADTPAPEPAIERTPAPDHATAPLDAAIPIDPTVTVGALDNGLSYYVRANQKPESRAELRLFVNAGSLQEDDDQLGLAHFVEHMAFNGTEHFEKQELVDYLQSIGMRFGADLNAYTSFDETVYMLTVPLDDPEIVEKGFQILADWAVGVAFEDEEIDKERGVVIEEWRLGRGAGTRLRDKQFPIIFRDSRYTDRLVISDKEILENAPYEAFRRFYRDWYRPDLMAVAAVGDFDPGEIEALIRKYFEPIPAAENPRPREVYPVPPHPETLMTLETDPELSRSNVSVLYKHPARPQVTYCNYRSFLVQSIYHGMLNSRLGELTQEADPRPSCTASRASGPSCARRASCRSRPGCATARSPAG